MKKIITLLFLFVSVYTLSFGQSSSFEKTILANTTTRVELTDLSNQSLKVGSIYRVKLSILTTSTPTGAEYLVWYSLPDSLWKLRLVSANGNISNHPLLEVSDNVVRVFTNHAVMYSIKVFAEVFTSGNGAAIPAVYGSSFQWQRFVNNLYYMDGYVGIGTTTPKEALSVNGNIRAKEIKVETTNWPDYVFEEDYKLPSLTETEQFIKENKHLPEVPKASEVEENGVSLGEMNKILLQKIEELTLHLIEKDKRLEKVEQKLVELESKSK
ncbi:hypothetical protein LZQ00_09990 [Sphingobacterium sp. SRCM116780]|uniref:hypothetical protein n=1 Tax=Sphingobacterium sp. SRCM116780 TaxID=2907623 RepID=UPI001F1857B7|nr:hypothetical protein [Sphingobacterium sp. SRCM116780]UIR54604.1 hypothetical protein LZQ00_09990 [Sphingobacterium sp. SRCM116780]